MPDVTYYCCIHCEHGKGDELDNHLDPCAECDDEEAYERYMGHPAASNG